MCVDGLWADALMYERSVALGRTGFEQGTIQSLQTRIQANPGLLACWEVQKQNFKYWGYSDFVDAVAMQRE